jgi:hypothetical protein
MDRQYVGIDFHRRRSVIVRLSAGGARRTQDPNHHKPPGPNPNISLTRPHSFRDADLAP